MITVVFSFSHMHTRNPKMRTHREKKSKQCRNVERVMLRSQAAAQGYGKGMGQRIRAKGK